MPLGSWVGHAHILLTRTAKDTPKAVPETKDRFTLRAAHSGKIYSSVFEAELKTQWRNF
jgi:hypothetical protein